MTAHSRGRWHLSLSAVLSGIVVVAAAVAIVIAVADDGARRASDARDVGRAETLVIGQFVPPMGEIANPYTAAGDALGYHGLWPLVFEPLFYSNFQTGELEPWLATGYEYSDDHKTLTLRLRDDVTWSDGEPFSADDVVFTLNQIRRLKAPFRGANIRSSVASVSKLSPTAVRIELEAPAPRFVEAELSSSIVVANLIPVPRHVFRGRRFDRFAFYDLARGWPVGTGPYTLTEVGASSMALTRDEDWWAARAGVAELPAPRRVVYTDPGPEDSAVSGLVANRLDYAGQQVPSVAGFIAGRERNPKLVNWDGELGWLDPCPYALTINTTAEPWDDPEMRWALNAALDKVQFSRVFNGPGEPTPARTTFPEYPRLSGLLDANRDLLDRYPTLRHDVAEAERTFQRKGYTKQDGVWTKGGEPLALRLSVFSPLVLGPAWRAAAELLDQQLGHVGIDARVEPAGISEIAAVRASRDFDAQSSFECGSATDPWATLNRYTNAPGNDNGGNWSNAEYDRLVARIGELAPGDRRIEPLFRRALEILLRELPVIPLSQRPTAIVMNRTYWENWPTAANDYTQPPPWWMNFHQVVTRLRPAR